MFKEFKAWMKFNPPEMATADKWFEFEERYKKEAPVRHWVMRGPIYTLTLKIKWRKRDFFYHIWSRFIVKNHIIKTDLRRGHYHDNSERMLHAVFKILEDYVEIECAYAHDYADTEKTLGWKRFLPRFIRPRAKDQTNGILHLLWEIELGEESPRQAKDAVEFYELYTWWKDVRPNRKHTPMPDTPNLPEGVFGGASKEWQKNHPEEYEQYLKWSDVTHDETTTWRKEDQEMLIRLVKVYESMWK